VRPDLAARLTGSAELFDRRFRKPWASVNFVASHDGFTLADVTAYQQKHNEANQEGNNDGHNENCSANWGMEGVTDAPEILKTRGNVARALIATNLLSLGTPMLLAGDEFGRSQGGNNNAYCQDNEISWMDWEQADSPAGRELTAFVGRVVALRKNYPLLREMRFLKGDREVLPGLYDVGWFDERGAALTIEAWQDPEGRALTLRRAGPGLDGEVDVMLIMMNGSSEALAFAPPAPHLEWNVLLDSAVPDAVEAALIGGELTIEAHSVAVLLAQPTGDADWQAVWMAGAHEGPRLLTALPPDPGTILPRRAAEPKPPEIPSQAADDTAADKPRE
jgi:glycogen operon protein